MRASILLALLGVLLLISLTSMAVSGPYLEALPNPARGWISRSVTLNDQAWKKGEQQGRYGLSVRGAILYAAGLLYRNAEGDPEAAGKIIDLVLAQQFDKPGAPWHGVFRRRFDEAVPPLRGSVIWKDYDPNWREFIGTTLILCLERFPQAFPEARLATTHQALRLAAAGAMRRRVGPEYTNIALMSAYLMAWCGERFEAPDWREAGRGLAEKVVEGFSEYGSFAEYNSPTYYGVNSYALALWRVLPPTPEFKKWGAAIDAAFWKDIGLFYHPGLKNLCGPYDRSYGMDMQRYFAMAGFPIALATGAADALPDLDKPFQHSHDFAFTPLLAMLGVDPPEAVRGQLAAFSGERYLVRPICGGRHARTAYAWLSKDYMMGAESMARPVKRSSQYHPVTLHWRTPGGGIGWIRLIREAPVDAKVTPGELTIHCLARRGSQSALEARFVIEAEGITADCFEGNTWRLPGITLHLVQAPEGCKIAIEGHRTEVIFPLEENDGEALFHFQVGA